MTTTRGPGMFLARSPSRARVKGALLRRLLVAHILFIAAEDDLLALESRRRIYDHVVRYPGLHLREIARGVAMDTNHAKYHLRCLETRGLVSSRREDGYWRFWPMRDGPLGKQEELQPWQKQAIAFLRRPVPLHIILLLADTDEATLGTLLQSVDISYSTLYYHLTKMEKAGLLGSRKDGRERWYRLADPDGILELLMRYRPPNRLVSGFLEAWEQLEIP